MRVEVALLYEDKTWDTEVVDVPKNDDESFEDAVSRWFVMEATQLDCYRKVVQAAVYNTQPEECSDEEDEEE